MADDQPQDTPEMPPADRPRGIAGMLDGLNATFNDLERYVAGYNTLTRAYQTVTNSLPPGARPKGLMISFKGSTDDQHAIDVNIDIQKHVHPEYAGHVIAPLANGQAMGMLAAVNELLKGGEELKAFIEAALGFNQQPAAPQPPAARAG